MAEIDKIVVFLSGLSFHIFLVAITSKHGVSLLAANSTFETNIMIGMQVLALALLLVSWVIVQALPKVAFIVLANLAFSLSAVLVIFLLVGFRVAYTVQSTHNDSLIIAFYVISAILSLLAAFWNFFSKI